MIVQEIITLHNQNFRHTYSSENKYIKQVETDAVYDHAYDTMARNFTYVETDEDVVDIAPPDIPQG